MTSIASLDNSLDVEIVRLKRCRGWLRRCDAEILRTGSKVFATDGEFARWLTAAHPALKGHAPIEIMYARDGKSFVHGILILMAEEKKHVYTSNRPVP